MLVVLLLDQLAVVVLVAHEQDQLELAESDP
jgi:hypothetical protein